MVIKISKIHARVRKTILNKLIPTDLPNITKRPIVEAHASGPKITDKKGVFFMSREYTQRHMFNPEDVLISISDSNKSPPALAHKPLDMLSLAFNDYVTDYEVKEFGWREMSREDAISIVSFVLKHKAAPNIIIHCNAGESRSKGAALAIAEITGREVFHISDTGSITNYKDNRYSFFNRRVFDSILMEHMRLDDKAV